jgi:hypothetical protein
MGIRVSDIPQGHPLRQIYPGKFKWKILLKCIS